MHGTHAKVVKPWINRDFNSLFGKSFGFLSFIKIVMQRNSYNVIDFIIV